MKTTDPIQVNPEDGRPERFGRLAARAILVGALLYFGGHVLVAWIAGRF